MLPSIFFIWGAICALYKVAFGAESPIYSDQLDKSATIDKRATNLQDFSWVRKWAAVGDSFTADAQNDKDCSRYDYTYPTIINRFLGPSVQQFIYTACSGAVTTDIYKQIQQLPPNLDLVVLTAGGNDLCLSDIISSCIVVGHKTESQCSAAIQDAQTALDGFFKDNIRQVLSALDEDWFLTPNVFGQLPLTKARRTIFNNLVQQTNAALRSVISQVASSAKTMTLIAADWDPWAPLSGGLFCEPGASPFPEDPSNKNEEFDILGVTYGNQSMNDDNFWNIAARAPISPGCPSGVDLPLPDSIGKIFHPNQLGHEVIAAYTLEAVTEARAKSLGLSSPSCQTQDSTQCASNGGSHGYVSGDLLNQNIGDFCSYVNQNHPAHNTGWFQSKTYFQGTPEEFSMNIQLSTNAFTFSEDVCNKALSILVNNCDNGSGNPMKWKSGGKRVEGEYTYTIGPKRTNRPWPPPTKPLQDCQGWYKFLFQSYDMRGAGWATWDWGQHTLLPNINPCCGSGSVTGWTFDYFDSPDADGYEWHAFFHTAIGTRRRCFDNSKVQRAAGGPCDSYCSGNG